MTEIEKKYSTTRMLIKKPQSKIRGKFFGLRKKGYTKQGTSDRPLISVVTVVLNEPDKLKITLESVLDQDYDNVEYVVIDGGSNDEDTHKILKNNDGYIDYWLSEKDEGIYYAMNKAILICSGDFITFLNAGDTFTQNNILSKVAVFIKEDNDVIYGDRNYIHTNGEMRFDKAKDIQTIYSKMPFCHQASFVKREILAKYKFNTNYRFSADYHFFVRLYRDGLKFRRIDLTICNFLSGGRSESGMRPHIEVVKILFDTGNDVSIIENSSYYRSLLSLSNKELQRIEKGMNANQFSSTISNLEEKLKAKEDLLKNSHQTIQQKDDLIKQKDDALKHKDINLSQKNQIIRLRDEEILRKNEVLSHRDETIRQKDILLDQRNETIKQKDILLDQRNETIKQKDILLDQGNETIKQKDILLDQRNETIKQKDHIVGKLSELLEQKAEILRLKEDQVLNMDNLLQQKIDLIEHQCADIQSKESFIEKLNECNAKSDSKIKEQDEIIRLMSIKIENLNINFHHAINDLNESQLQLKKNNELLLANSEALREKSQQLLIIAEKLKNRDQLIKNIEHSYTFRVGKLITFPFRKLLGR